MTRWRDEIGEDPPEVTAGGGTEAAETAAAPLARERAKLLSMLGAALVHELRNPLAYIVANHQMLGQDLIWLLERTDDAESRARLVDLQDLMADCRTGVTKLSTFLDALSRMTSARALREGGTTLAEVVDGTMKLMRPRLVRFETAVEMAADLPVPAMSPPALAQALMVLLGLASDAAQRHADGAARVGSAAGARTLRLVGSVGAPHPGASAAPTVELHLAWTGVDEGGAGDPDLEIVRAALTEAGGTLEVRPAAGGAATFVLRIPAVR
jgi:two-component system NtrC family sensor kinase